MKRKKIKKDEKGMEKKVPERNGNFPCMKISMDGWTDGWRRTVQC